MFMKNLSQFFAAMLMVAMPMIAHGQSCAIDRVPSSATVPVAGGQTYPFSIIRNGNCTPVFSVSHSWLTYTYSGGLLRITAAANTGPSRVGYVYVDNKESLKITISQGFIPVTSVTVTPAKAFLNMNETLYPTATVLPTNASMRWVNWSSSAPSIATVISGQIKGVAPGTAIITATSGDGLKSATCVVTVSAEPKAFTWKNVDGNNWISPVKNQRTQGPCFIFAAVGVIEMKYRRQQMNATLNVDLSEGWLHPTCSGVWESIPHTFDISQNEGIVDEQCYTYDRSQYGGGQSLNCDNPCTSPQYKMKISGYTCLNLLAVAANVRADVLKQTIRTQGSVAISFHHPGLHNDRMHAYELYGWRENTWIMKDSWENAMNENLETEIDIPNVLASTETNFVACYVNSIASANGRIGASSTQEPETLVDFDGLPTLYPNPANTEIKLANIEAEGNVEVYKTDGVLVYSGKPANGTLDISAFTGGTYLVKVTEKHTVRVLKFVKL